MPPVQTRPQIEFQSQYQPRYAAGWTPLLAHKQLASGANLHEVLEAQPRFQILSDHANNRIRISPDSEAAVALLQTQQTRDLLQGIVLLHAEVSGADSLTGISFSNAADGYLANRLSNDLARFKPTEKRLASRLPRAEESITKTRALRAGSWLHFGPERSQPFLDRMNTPASKMPITNPEASSFAVKTLLHELNHAGSLIDSQHKATHDWLSEGTAEVLARWPGRVEDAAQQLRMPSIQGFHSAANALGKPYVEEVAALRGLLQLAGIDETPANFQRAEQLLNGAPEPEVIANLSHRILERHAKTLTATDISTAIRAIAPDGEHADPTSVQSLQRIADG